MNANDSLDGTPFDFPERVHEGALATTRRKLKSLRDVDALKATARTRRDQTDAEKAEKAAVQHAEAARLWKLCLETMAKEYPALAVFVELGMPDEIEEMLRTNFSWCKVDLKFDVPGHAIVSRRWQCSVKSGWKVEPEALWQVWSEKLSDFADLGNALLCAEEAGRPMNAPEEEKEPSPTETSEAKTARRLREYAAEPAHATCEEAGLTKREWFAGMALAGGWNGDGAVDQADALLRKLAEGGAA